MTTFQYTALQQNEIRVLILDAGDDEDALSGTLVAVDHVPGENVTRYEAMSYTWGDQSDPDYIHLRHSEFITHGESPGSLPIGRNLASALRQIRHKIDSRILWADSICINQQDLDERAAQVQRMRDIYKYAQRVIAWLGPADGHSPIAIGLLQELADCIDFTKGDEDILNNRMTFKREKYDFIMSGPAHDINSWSKPLPYSDQQWKAVASLISRSWFRRLWVRQEVLLAGKDTILLVGGNSMLWHHFTSAIEVIAQKRSALAGKVKIHMMIEFTNVRTFRILRHLTDFFTLVAYTHSCEVTEPRDRVYALLGLADGDFTRKIVVDYRKNAKDIHREALVRASTYHQDLKLLSLCDSASEPTWIPDLERIQQLRPITFGRAALCSAERGHAITKEQLVLQGIRCDYITELIGPQDGQSSQAQLEAALLKAARRFLGHDVETWNFQKVQQFSLTFHVNDSYIYPPLINKVQQQLAERISSNSETLGAQLEYLTYYIHNRSIYLTKMGYIALGPRNCQLGDPVVVFLGCHLPMVLQPIEDGEYKLRGPCSHPALLSSEALLGEMPKGWRLRYTRCVEEPLFENAKGERQHIDPRLDDIPVPQDWELRWRSDGTPFWYIAKEDRWTNFDPRLTLKRLRKRGVKVDDYTLR
ncbi:Ff.00g033950.m01.CDS01 [Fusarium sp. VM40]|nr:Ff.00g033950.m01.CDS01 [Fusarium sp. VM40]